MASATVWPCASRTSTWRSLATISSGLCLFRDMVVLLGFKAICGTTPRARALNRECQPKDGAVICSACERGHGPLASMEPAMRTAHHTGALKARWLCRPLSHRAVVPWVAILGLHLASADGGCAGQLL